ncbi:hypothetical protein Tco_1519740, partial [Tanacetum coccineum]
MILIGDGDWDVNRFPDGDGKGMGMRMKNGDGDAFGKHYPKIIQEGAWPSPLSPTIFLWANPMPPHAPPISSFQAIKQARDWIGD